MIALATAAPEVEGGKAKQYMDTDEAAACAEWKPDIVVLGPFGKHDALGQYPPPKGGARYDAPASFTTEEYYAELKELVAWAQGFGAKLVALALPVPFPFGSKDHAGAQIVRPATAKLAADLGLPVIDLFSPFADRKEAFTDADHLEDKEIDLMAETTASALRIAWQASNARL